MAAKKRGTVSRGVVAQARQGGGASSSSAGRRAWNTVKSFGGAVVIYLILRTFLIEAFRIPSGSMIPSLLIGDWLFVNKAAYGAHIPFTSTLLPGYSAPNRGDVVVFISPYQADDAARGLDPTPTLVKRLVGMPGDTMYMRDGVLHINGLAQRQGYAAAANPKGDGTHHDPMMEWQHRIELTGTRFGAPPKTPTLDHWGPLLIPAGHYFMMGDNRHESKDSRYWSVVPRANVRGRPLFVYYSAPCMSIATCVMGGPDSDGPLPMFLEIRWSRLGQWIR